MAPLPPGTGGGEGTAYGRPGPGRRIPSRTDGAGRPWSTRTTPANGAERAQGLPLLDSLHIHTGTRGRPRKRLKVLALDTGYDAKALRRRLRRRGLRPQIPTRVWKRRKPPGRPIQQDVPRAQVERTFAWFQRKYRRLVVRWERLAACFNAFLAVAMMHLWVRRLIAG